MTSTSPPRVTAPPDTPAIRLRSVTKVFHQSDTPAVDSLDLDVQRGEIVALLGPSGCGKTTTLRMINRLIEPTSGTIEIDGVDTRSRPVTELRRNIGYVIQQIGLFPHRSVARNISEVPRMLKWDRTRIDARVAELIDLVGLEPDMLHRYPDELSGGQQQRVGVARALAADPPVLLMDEPFGAVDPIVRTRLQDELLALQAHVRKSIVIVTHDLDEALRVADRIALLNVGGILEQIATPDELLRAPASAFVARFIGEDRSVRRLGLSTIASVDHHRGPVVEFGASAADGIEAMEREGVDWLGILDDGNFLGWIGGDDVRAASSSGADLGSLDRFPPSARVSPDDTLKAAMEQIMMSNTSVAVIDDGGRFGGVITLEDLRRALAAP